MKVVVLGAGLIGVASAYYLWRDGHDVEVIEQHAEAASVTSYANAYPRKQARLGAAYAVFAMLAVPLLTYVLPNSTPNTLHPKGTITTSKGLSREYKIVLWSGVLGLSLVYVWTFRLHVALDAVQLRLNARSRWNPGRES